MNRLDRWSHRGVFYQDCHVRVGVSTIIESAFYEHKTCPPGYFSSLQFSAV